MGQCSLVLPSTLLVERETAEEGFEWEQGPHVSTPVVEPKRDTDEGSDQMKDSDIHIDQVRSATIKVPIHVNGRLTKALLDTGAEVTVLDSHLYFGILEKVRPILKKATRNLIVAEAGKNMETHGIAIMKIKLGSRNFTWEMYVAPISDDVLLGCDVVDEMDITINFRKGIQLDGQWINCEVERKTDDQVARVVLTENITVPANSEIILSGKSKNPEVIDTRYSVLQPVVEDNRKIMVAQLLVDPFEKIIPVRLVNMEEHPVHLRRNYLLGEVHAVKDINPFSTTENHTNISDNNMKNSCKLHDLKTEMKSTNDKPESVCIPGGIWPKFLCYHRTSRTYMREAAKIFPVQIQNVSLQRCYLETAKHLLVPKMMLEHAHLLNTE